ncbi:UDP-glucose 4-epimerase GalE [Candidatus Latescibacterota bacterium]
MNVLVTGGAGYIGSVTTAGLLAQGHHVTVLDNLSSGHRKAVHPDARFIQGDISDKSVIRGVCRDEIDVVMHFAAFIEVGESTINPSKYYDNNLIKSIRFLDNLREADVNRLVFSSTAAVYGEPERIPLEENAALRPVNPYGKSKMVVEQVLEDYDRAYNFKSISLRYFNAGGAFGPYGEDHNPESHLIPLIIDAALNSSPLKVFGNDYDTSDGSCIRDYIHVRDLAEAHILAAGYLCKGGCTDYFNLGTGRGYTVLEVIKTAEKITGKSINLEITGRREGDSAVLVASPKKAKHVLGWNKQLASLEEIIGSAWEWRKQNINGYRE